ncbi:MAG: hypothetical protein ABIH03_08415 [Pseudomonadota bacterium]
MRDPLLLRARLSASQLSAEHARRRQRRREAALGHCIPPGDRHLAEQIAGLPVNAYAIRHIAPRIFAIGYLTTPSDFSFHFNVPDGFAFTQIW